MNNLNKVPYNNFFAFFVFIRILIKYLFTKHPYRTLSFHTILKKSKIKYKNTLNIPEQYTDILFTEKLPFTVYQKPVFIKDISLPVETEYGKPYRVDWGVFPNPEVTVYSLANGGIIGTEGFIYDPTTRAFINESIAKWFYWDDKYFNSYKCTLNIVAPQRLKGISLNISKRGGTGFYHFLHESLPKLIYLKEYIENIDHVVVSGGETKFKKEWLKLAGIEEQKIVYTANLSHYICDQLLFVSDLIYQYRPNQFTCNLLKKVSYNVSNSNSVVKSHKWIWASRDDADFRKLEWEEDLLKRFPHIQKVLFSKLTPQETIFLLQDCSVFIGPHGAAFSNICFCPPGCDVIEVVFGYYDPLYSRLAQMCNLKHFITDVSQKKDLETFLHSLVYTRYIQSN